MAIQQRPDDASIQDSVKGFVLLLGFPFSDDFAVVREAANVQSFGIRGPATPAGVVRSVLFLKRFVTHDEIS